MAHLLFRRLEYEFLFRFKALFSATTPTASPLDEGSGYASVVGLCAWYFIFYRRFHLFVLENGVGSLRVLATGSTSLPPFGGDQQKYFFEVALRRGGFCSVAKAGK